MSRDRQWCLFKRQAPDSFKFDLVHKEKDAHTRIIWGCSWAHDDSFFVTVSREKHDSVKLWTGVNQTSASPGQYVAKVPDSKAPSATAVSFFPSKIDGNYAFVVGLESGAIQAWLTNTDPAAAWTLMFSFPDYWAHAQAVRRIKFNVTKADSREEKYTIATCSNDHSVRVFEIIKQK